MLQRAVVATRDVDDGHSSAASFLDNAVRADPVARRAPAQGGATLAITWRP
jgi:hypothetical protein